MAEGATSLKELRAQYVAAAQAQADERRSQSVNSPVLADPSPVIVKAPTKPVIDGSILKTVERQRLAKARREEKEKEMAAKEYQLLEKEKKARLQYAKQVEERQKKLDEQRQKEQQKRVAVEEKRKQKQEEEKERYEAVMRRTLERSQRLEQRQKRWSWGGAVSTEKENSNGEPDSSLTPPLSLSDCPPPSSDSQTSTEDGSAVDKRSTSSVNLMKQAGPVMNKRLSSSSTALPNSPDRGTADKKRSSSLNRLASNPRSSTQVDKLPREELQARRSQNSPMDSSIISRLLMPTQSSLARSKSAAALPEAGQGSAASAGPVNSPINAANKPVRSRSIDRQNSVDAAAGGVTPVETTQKQIKEKRPSSPTTTASRRRSPSPNLAKRPPSPSNPGARRPSSPSTGTRRPPSPSNTGARRPPSPSNAVKRSTSPSVVKSSPKNCPPAPSTFKQHPPSPTSVHKPLPVHRPPAASAGATTTKKKMEKEGKPKQKSEVTGTEKESSTSSSKSKDSEQKPGTTSAEEAAKILAENRRLAREQKEREEQARLQLAEAEKLRREELKKKEAEEKVRREEAARVQREEQKLAEEENQRKSEEERLCRDREEQERLADLKLQREEAEAKAAEDAERQRLERERIMQQNQQERLERKKRIKEIMKRTRKGDQQLSKKDERMHDAAAEESSEDEPRNEDADEVDSTNGIDELQDQAQDGVELSEAVGHEPTGLNGVNQTNNITVHLNKESVMGVSAVPKDNCVVSELLHVNEVGESTVHQNGKSSTWIIDEFIELGVCSKTDSKLTVAACDAEDCNQSILESRSIGFEENGAVTSLTKAVGGVAALNVLIGTALTRSVFYQVLKALSPEAASRGLFIVRRRINDSS